MCALNNNRRNLSTYTTINVFFFYSLHFVVFVGLPFKFHQIISYTPTPVLYSRFINNIIIDIVMLKKKKTTTNELQKTLLFVIKKRTLSSLLKTNDIIL